MKTRHVMDGYRILDFTQVVAATRLMAEMGAEVIEVERAPLGDMTRYPPIQKNVCGSYLLQQNRGKKSLRVNPEKPAGIQNARRYPGSRPRLRGNDDWKVGKRILGEVFENNQ